jgi:Skp family chaperone for outer membrane proteins
MNDTTGTAARQLVALEQESKQYYAQLEKKEKEANAKRSTAIAISEEKLEKAIQDVAKENKYSAVMDVQQVIYHDAADNITSLVLKKLGITAK